VQLDYAVTQKSDRAGLVLQVQKDINCASVCVMQKALMPFGCGPLW